jgi:glucuronate isomerase
MEGIESAADQRQAAAQVREDIRAQLSGFVDAGYGGIMTSEGVFDQFDTPTHLAPEELDRADNSRTDIGLHLLHALCAAAETEGLFVQLFLGVRGNWANRQGGTPANDPERILNLHGLFQRYDCPFELVLAAELNTLDLVQAARIFPHVHLGGLWWYNFRASSYRRTMQVRLEALPPLKSALVASDARCIEWCYGKILLVKRLMADYLYDQVTLGWLSTQDALWVAREWLHDAAARLYAKGNLSKESMF